MSLITTATQLANIAGSKIGSFGDQVGAAGTLANLNGTDQITVNVNLFLPLAREKAIRDLARACQPFRETFKFADLEDDLKADDIGITSVTGDGAAVTVVTDEAHGLSGGDTRFLADLQGDADTLALNGTTVTVASVPSTTSFTFADTYAGTHTADSGIISKAPDIGEWLYAFDLPSDFVEIVGQYDESGSHKRKNYQSQYPCATMLNIDGDGWLLLTDDISNDNGDSAYVGYVKDSTAYSIWSYQFVDCVATNLAIMLCPVVGKDMETQKKLEVYYAKKALPDAKKYNAMFFVDKITTDLDYTGRKKHIGYSVKGNQLGTYVSADGTRRDV